jgi:hypothetical protein
MKTVEYVLVTYKSNWADEMDVTGFVVIPKQRWKELQIIAKKVFELRPDIELYIGTNESINYDSYASYKADLIARGLSEVEVKVLRRFFPSAFREKEGFGHTPFINEEHLLDAVAKSEEKNESEASAIAGSP